MCTVDQRRSGGGGPYAKDGFGKELYPDNNDLIFILTVHLQKPLFGTENDRKSKRWTWLDLPKMLEITGSTIPVAINVVDRT